MPASTRTAPAPTQRPETATPKPLTAIERLVAEAPPLSQAQRDKLAVVLAS